MATPRLTLSEAAAKLLPELQVGQTSLIALWLADDLTGWPDGARLGGNKTRHVEVKVVMSNKGRKVIIELGPDGNPNFPLASDG